MSAPESRFSIDELLSRPRPGALVVSPAGDRLVLSVAELDAKGTKYVSSLWELPVPGPALAPVRLTWGAQGESSPAYLPDGSLVFVSSRPPPGVESGGEPVDSLWLLPATGGEARWLGPIPGGVAGSGPEGGATFVTSRGSRRVAFGIDAFPGMDSREASIAEGRAREERGVSGFILDGYPIRWWDRFLGPRTRRLLVAEIDPAGTSMSLIAEFAADADEPRALEEPYYDLSPDGRLLVTTWWRTAEFGGGQRGLAAFPVSGGPRRDLAVAAGHDVHHVAFSPDGSRVVVVLSELPSPGHVPLDRMAVIDVTSGAAHDPAPGFHLSPSDPAWSADGRQLHFGADDRGRHSLWRVSADGGTPECLTRAGALAPFALGSANDVYAIRSWIASPPEIVRVKADARDQVPEVLHRPGLPLPPGIRTEEGETLAADGTPIHHWLVLPANASADNPAPLVLFVHGGPYSTWSTWSWRWNPAVLADAGYAVLLPDPALSTGYGQAHLDRGAGKWGAITYEDVMASLDAVLARPEIDAKRTAMMGGSFGGYMANWIARQTDRFQAIVTHASLWTLDRFNDTTDDAHWLDHEFGQIADHRAAWEANDPSRQPRPITTPMLVIHGDRDYRVPVSEGLHLWTDLQRMGNDAKFLYFPDEGHWILRPGNSRLWYRTVIAFLDHHVLGRPWVAPKEVLPSP